MLIVCHGNIYRSALVGEYLRARFQPSILVRSTGFHETAGRPSPDRHVKMAERRGVDLSKHASSRIEPADLEWADIVVLMDRGNWVRLRRMGARSERLIWLGAFAPGQIEIQDPYRMDDAAASRLVDRLLRCAGGLARCVNLGRQAG